jgi:predicted DNA binding CopG/RHH family protein
MNTKERQRIEDTAEAWESRELGADEAFVEVVELDDKAVDDALELVPISIRLQRPLIEDFKMIARINGLGYQPLMRQVLSRFAEAEKRRLIQQSMHSSRHATTEGELEDSSPPPAVACG